MKNTALLQLLTLSLLLQAGLAKADTYTSPQDVSLESQEVSSVISGRDVSLQNVTVNGKLIAGRDVDLQHGTVSGHITAGRDLQLSQCERVHSITSGHNTSLSNTHVQSSVTVGHDLTLNNAVLEHETQVGNQIIAENSTIQGPLFLQGHYLKLDHSTAETITFKKPEPAFLAQGVHVTGNVVLTQGSHTMVQVGANNTSSVNGYTIQGTPSQTTVITPEGTIYVNGRKVSGEGAKSYGEYQAAHTGAPNVQGPGWLDTAAQTEPAASTKKQVSEIPVNTLELMNHSKIGAAVVFESGYGKILVHPGSEFTGKVSNGRVERLAN